MPPKTRITREAIISASLNIIRESGIECLGARAVAKNLGCSTQPIFDQFNSMEELKNAVMLAAYTVYREKISFALKSQEYPPYKASGLAYIHFARDERNLFRWLFMRDRSKENISDSFADDNREVIDIIKAKTGFTEETALMFHLENWVVVHGIASMLATEYLSLNNDTIDQILSDAFFGLLSRYKEMERK